MAKKTALIVFVNENSFQLINTQVCTYSNHMTQCMQWTKECCIEEVFIQDDYHAYDGDLITCIHDVPMQPQFDVY